MTVQVLVATMHQKDHTLPQQLNLQCDAVVGNQGDRNAMEDDCFRAHRVLWIHSTLRGLSYNRNLALLFADADICLLADDDVVYEDGYVDTVCRAFEQHPDADVLLFDIRTADAPHGTLTRTRKIRWYNCLKWGSVRMAFRLESIRRHGIAFHLAFGAGTPRGYGEDTLFLVACLRHHLTVYTVPSVILSLSATRASTWFVGYDDAYLHNKGLLFREISPRFWWLLCLQDAYRHRRRYALPWYRAFRRMV